MKKITVLLAIFSLLFCAGCQKKENDIRTSIFIEDKDDQGLPAVTEWGYNYFGAYVYKNDVKSIFTGTLSSLRKNGNDVSVEFNNTLSDCYVNRIMFTIKNTDDIYSLNGKTYDLSDKSVCEVRVNGSDTIDVSNGFVRFSRVNYVYFNGNKTNKTLFCGEFSLSGKHGPVNLRFEKGRFDMINDD